MYASPPPSPSEHANPSGSCCLRPCWECRPAKSPLRGVAAAFVPRALCTHGLQCVVAAFESAGYMEVCVLRIPTISPSFTRIAHRTVCRFRETLKASGDEVHAALRDAELRVGQALSSGDAAKRDAEASRAEARTLRARARMCVRVCGVACAVCACILL